MIVDDISLIRENAAELERVLELRYLGDRMRELSQAVDSIPTVYDLNKKYAHGKVFFSVIFCFCSVLL